MSRFLSFLHNHSRWSWIALAVYAACVTFPHQSVQWAANELAIRYTHRNLYRGSAAVAVLEVAVLTIFLLRRLASQPQRRLAAGLWVLSLALICGAWQGFTANNLELVHYPQYFPEGVALLALTLSPAEALSWVVILGGLDEGYQFWVLSKGKPTLFDFNDIYMDLLGGAAGIAFALAFLKCTRRSPSGGDWLRTLRRPGVMVLLGALLLGVVLWASGAMLVVEDKANSHYWFDLGRFQAPSFWATSRATGRFTITR